MAPWREWCPRCWTSRAASLPLRYTLAFLRTLSSFPLFCLASPLSFILVPSLSPLLFINQPVNQSMNQLIFLLSLNSACKFSFSRAASAHGAPVIARTVHAACPRLPACPAGRSHQPALWGTAARICGQKHTIRLMAHIE